MSAEGHHGHPEVYNKRLFSWRMIAIAAGFTAIPLLFSKPTPKPVTIEAPSTYFECLRMMPNHIFENYRVHPPLNSLIILGIYDDNKEFLRNFGTPSIDFRPTTKKW